MVRRTRILMIALGVCMTLCAIGLTAEPDSAEAQQIARAREATQGGAYARAIELLQKMDVDALSADAQVQRVELLGKARDAAVEVYQRVQAVRESYRRNADQTEQRRQAIAMSLSSLKRKATQLQAEGKYAEARDVLMEAARRRASYSLDVARSLIERAHAGEAKDILQKIKASRIDIPDAGDIDRLIALADTRAANYQAGSKLYAARVKAEEAAGQHLAQAKAWYQEAVAAWETAGKAATRERKIELYNTVERLAEDIRQSPAQLAPEAQQTLQRLARRAASRKQQAVDERNRAENYLAEGLQLAEKGQLLAARSMLLEAVDMDALDAADHARALAAVADVQKKVEVQVAEQRENFEAARQRITEQLTAQQRAVEWQKILAQQAQLREKEKRAAADVHLETARAHFNAGRFDQALVELEKALEILPGHDEARDLYEKILLLTDRKVSPRQVIERTGVIEQVRREQARLQMTAYVQEAMDAKEAGRHDEALEKFQRASNMLDYLAESYNVQPVRNLITEQMEEVRRLRSVARRGLEQERLQESDRALATEADRATRLEQEQFQEMYKKALRFYTMQDYEAASDAAQTALKYSPRNPRALTLYRKAKDAYRTQVWVDIRELAEEARSDKLLSMKKQLVLRPELIVYPSAEVWREISARGPVPLPSAEATKTPRELQLEDALETRVSLEYEVPTELIEIVDFLNEIVRTEIGATNTIRVDPRIVQIDPRNVQITQENIRLRKALTLLLTDATTQEEEDAEQGLEYFIYRDAGVIYITAKPRMLRLKMKQKEFRFYDVRDLLAVLGVQGAGGSGRRDDDDDTTDDFFNDDDDDDDTTRTGSGMGDLISLLVRLTGRENWGDVDTTNDDDDDDTDTDFGGGGGLLGDTVTGEEGTGADYLGRMYQYGTGDLLIDQTPEMHARVEEVLTRLREMTEQQVYVEVRFINFRDNFLNSFGVTSIGEIRNKTSREPGEKHLGVIPRFETLFSISSIPPATGELTSGLDMTINFLDYEDRSMILSAVKESNFASVMQAPSLLIMNADDSEITLGQEVTYTSGFEVSAETGTLIPETDTETNDVTVWMRPVISADRRYVTLEVEPDFDTVDELVPRIFEDTVTRSLPDGGTETRTFTKTYFEPTTSNKSLYARVRVPDRGSVILGGLTDASTSNREGGVPILINLPLIKRLFSAKTEQETRAHQVFLVSTTIMIPEEIEAKVPVW